jgi:choline dehydrogenase
MAHATEILLEGKRAVGVRYAAGGRGGPLRTVRADREVILCGGSYNSPQLLHLSGIGAPALLEQLSIPVRHALPGVGENLSDHYLTRFVARVHGIETINERVRGFKLGIEALKWLVARKGVLSISPTVVYGFWRSDPDVPTSDVQITFTPASYKDGVQGQLEEEPGMTVAAWAQRPESRGFVHAVSADPFTPPRIQANYLAAEADRRVTLGAMRLARRLLLSEPLQPWIVREEVPGPDIRSDDELLDVAKRRGLTAFHPAGTCKMGPSSDPMAVVDDQLRVHGLTGLRVVDASVLPTMISANLNATTIMIGDKASDMILGREPEPAAVL